MSKEEHNAEINTSIEAINEFLHAICCSVRAIVSNTSEFHSIEFFNRRGHVIYTAENVERAFGFVEGLRVMLDLNVA